MFPNQNKYISRITFFFFYEENVSDSRFVLIPGNNFVGIDKRPVPILNKVKLVVFLRSKGWLITADRGGLQD